MTTLTDALVLRVQDYRDTDRIVWLFSRESGRVSALARGARKSRRRFAGHLDLFHLVRVVLSKRGRPGGLAVMAECTAVALHPALRCDVKRFAVANLAAELLLHLAPEAEADTILFETAVTVFAALAAPEVPVGRALVSATLLPLLTAAGFAPDFRGCTHCGRPTAADEPHFYLEHDGALACAGCRDRHRPLRALLAPDCQWLARRQQGEPWPAAAPPTNGTAQPPAGDVLGAVFDIVHRVTGPPLKAESFLRPLLADCP
jgi:DNA repair protein RecO (recombination protein O)